MWASVWFTIRLVRRWCMVFTDPYYQLGCGYLQSKPWSLTNLASYFPIFAFCKFYLTCRISVYYHIHKPFSTIWGWCMVYYGPVLFHWSAGWTRSDCSFSPTDQVWPDQPTFFITGQNGQTGLTVKPDCFATPTSRAFHICKNGVGRRCSRYDDYF